LKQSSYGLLSSNENSSTAAIFSPLACSITPQIPDTMLKMQNINTNEQLSSTLNAGIK